VIASLAPRVSLLVALLLSSSGCLTLTYLTQAAAGQEELNRRAQDIDGLVSQRRVDPRTRRLLSRVPAIKRFGEAHGLTATNNYRKYVRVDRPALVWVVSASDPLAFRSRSWSFPLVGSFTYLGWFHLEDAKRFAADLSRMNLDVDLRGSSAYSTAGFFEDAIVSTLIPPDDEALGELADTVLHEMTHATFFVRHQSTLNESVANFTGRGLAEDYLDGSLGADADETRAYVTWEEVADRRGRAMQAAYDALEALYLSSRSDPEKLEAKGALLARLHDEVHFRRPINNATLIQYRTYHSGQDELASLLRACDGSWPRFFASLKILESEPFRTAQESDVGKVVEPLVEAGCPSHLSPTAPRSSLRSGGPRG
jgi:predicted aminopeptidase